MDVLYSLVFFKSSNLETALRLSYQNLILYDMHFYRCNECTHITFFSLGEFNGALGLVTFTAKQGPQAFFKGFIPAFVRLGPHTILTFIFLEQLRLNFGINPASIK